MHAQGTSHWVSILVLGFVVFFLFRKKSDPEEIRRRDLRALARKLQLQYNPQTDYKLAGEFSFLSWLRRGDCRYGYNVFRGSYEGYQVTVFDYHFATPAGRGGALDYYWSACVVHLGANFPDLMISPETRETRFAEILGAPHITFESADFSRAFRVGCSDKKFAYEICHPQMMEYLMANRGLTVEISGTGLALLFEDWLHPETIEANLARLIELRKLLPEHFFSKA